MSDNRIVTSEYLDNGMPCHRYILRNLSNTVQAVEFTKAYVSTMLKAGATYEEIENSLPLLSLKLPANSSVQGHDFLSGFDTSGGALSFIDSICLDDNVPSYKHCYQFYRKFDKKCLACKLCPLSEKYLNKFIDTEKKVLAYALSSPTNFSYVKEKGVESHHFRSVFDALSYFAGVKQPGCYPLFSNTFAALCSDEAICDDFFKSREQGKLGQKLLTYHASCLTNGYIPKEQRSADTVMSLSTVLTDEIINTKIPDINIIDILILKLLNPDMEISACSPKSESTQAVKEVQNVGVDRPDTVISGESNLGADRINDFYETPPAPKKKRKKKKRVSQDVTVDVVVEAETDTVSSSDDAGQPVVNEVTLTDILSTEEERFTTPETNVLSDDGVDEPVSPPIGNRMAGTGEYVDAEIVRDFYFKHTYDSAEMSKAITITEIESSDAESCGKYAEIPGGGLVSIPIVPMSELSHFCLALDSENVRLLSMFESHVAKDKRLCAELVMGDDGEYYVLFYSQRLHAYFYTDMGSNVVREIVVPLLSHASIMKFCYYPFPLVSVLWKMGIYIKGVQSLFSMSSIILGDHRYDMSTALIRMGATAAVGGVTIRPEGEINSVPVLYMHSYPTIYHRGRQKIVAKGLAAEFETRNHFDVLLGYSYYQHKYIEGAGLLFSLESANGYRFNPLENTVLEDAKYLRLTFSDIPVSASTIVRDLLCRLDDGGRFKQFGILISNVTAKSFTLYVKEMDIKHVTTVVNTTLLSYLREKDLRGLDFVVEAL